MKKQWLVTIGCFLPMLYAPAAIAQQPPTLVSAHINTKTLEEDKDADTCIFVEARTADSKKVLAHISGAVCADPNAVPGYRFYPDEKSTLNLILDSPGLTKEACKGFRVKMWQKTHHGAGHDTWKFDANVILVFSDRSELNAYKGHILFVSGSEADTPTADFVENTPK